ncbi:MAG: hypothetical protein M1812_001488 [Candelaria pacifica]|nr:MAG: hypothetical protein M1812_001488 [Candelaria pacifica]
MDMLSEAGQARSLSESVPDMSGSRLQPGLFTLSVGPENRLFEIHKAVLCQSPVLARLCDSNFKEAHDRHIRLPEDDADAFGKVLEYLYSQTYTPATTSTSPSALASEMGDLYIMADKYQLNLLKALMVQKFRTAIVSTTVGKDTTAENLWALFKESQHIYANVPESDFEFRNYFKEVAPQCLLRTTKSEVTDFLKDIKFEGSFGKDLFEASIEALRLQSILLADEKLETANLRAKQRTRTRY